LVSSSSQGTISRPVGATPPKAAPAGEILDPKLKKKEKKLEGARLAVLNSAIQAGVPLFNQKNFSGKA
jgi:hypothetical protein